jgi:hypothetical protein
MEIFIENQHGSETIAVLTLDGSKAIEGIDYKVVRGLAYFGANTYHKWYEINNGIIVYNERCYYPELDNARHVKIIINGEITDFFVMWPEHRRKGIPLPPKDFPLKREVWIKIINLILEFEKQIH